MESNKIQNIQELKTRKGISLSSVNLLGYYNSGDGGNGAFYWDNDSIETDDKGTVIEVTGQTTGRWKRNVEIYITPEMFGAKGDGITDDSDAIINALQVSGAVYFKSKTYLITKPITLNKSINIFGNSTVILRKYNVSNPYYVFNATGIDLIRIEGIDFRVSEDTAHSLEGGFLFFDTCNYLSIEKCKFYCEGNFGETLQRGIDLIRCQFSKISSNFFSSTYGDMLYLRNECSFNTIKDNYFFNYKSAGVALTNASFNNKVIDNEFFCDVNSVLNQEADFFPTGINIQSGKDTLIMNNTVTKGNIGIKIVPVGTGFKNLIVRNNFIRDVSTYTSQTSVGIFVQFNNTVAGVSNISILENTVSLGNNYSAAIFFDVFQNDNILKVNGNSILAKIPNLSGLRAFVFDTHGVNRTFKMYSGKNSVNLESSGALYIQNVSNPIRVSAMLDEEFIDATIDRIYNGSSPLSQKNFLVPYGNYIFSPGLYFTDIKLSDPYTGNVGVLYAFTETIPNFQGDTSATMVLNSTTKTFVGWGSTVYPGIIGFTLDYAKLWRVL